MARYVVDWTCLHCRGDWDGRQWWLQRHNAEDVIRHACTDPSASDSVMSPSLMSPSLSAAATYVCLPALTHCGRVGGCREHMARAQAGVCEKDGLGEAGMPGGVYINRGPVLGPMG